MVDTVSTRGDCRATGLIHEKVAQPDAAWTSNQGALEGLPYRMSIPSIGDQAMD